MATDGRRDIGRAQSAISTQIFREEVRHTGTREVSVELVSNAAEAADALHLLEEARLDLVQRASHLAIISGCRPQFVELLVDDLPNLVEAVSRPRRSHDHEDAPEVLRLLERGDVLGDLQVVHESTIEPRVLAASEQ